jgi:hypothetical protein
VLFVAVAYGIPALSCLPARGGAATAAAAAAAAATSPSKLASHLLPKLLLLLLKPLLLLVLLHASFVVAAPTFFIPAAAMYCCHVLLPCTTAAAAAARRDERDRVKAAGARVMTLDQIEGLKDPTTECWTTEEEDDGDPPRLWFPNGMYPGTAFTRSIGDAGP